MKQYCNQNNRKFSKTGKIVKHVPDFSITANKLITIETVRFAKNQ